MKNSKFLQDRLLLLPKHFMFSLFFCNEGDHFKPDTSIMKMKPKARIKRVSCQSCTNVNCVVRKYCSPYRILSIDKQRNQFISKQNQNIISEGSHVEGIYFIQKGKVKVSSTGFTGKPQIVRFANDGHILGHRSIGSSDKHQIDAIAMEDSLICFIENDLLSEIFLGVPEFTLGMMMFYARELRKMEKRMKNIPRMNAKEKVAETLLLMLETFGLNKRNELDVLFSREDIANSAGTTVEQVSKILADFELEGLIVKHGRKIVIAKSDGLNEVINEQNLYSIA